jgi:hypothetical protein
MNDIELTMTEDNTPSNELTEAELEMLRGLNARGFAVAVFTPDELDDADYLDVEDAMIEAGWNVIWNEERTRE